VPFTLAGENGMFAYLDKVLCEKGHAVVCVAEGAGQVGCAVEGRAWLLLIVAIWMSARGRSAHVVFVP